MKLICITIAYKEERLIKPFIQHMQDRVDEIVVLNSIQPWNGDAELDNTAQIAESLGATVFRENWPDEHTQRNAGQEYGMDADWLIILDPDEYILDEDWRKLIKFLETAEADAYVPEVQYTYWKKHWIIDPPEEYRQIVAVRPDVRFVDKRVIDSPWGVSPSQLHHMSWRRNDAEVWRKINTYGHAGEFNQLKWFSEVWQDQERFTDLHPLTPSALKEAVRVKLPPELEELGL